MAQAQRLVVIGASAGGFTALIDLLAGLPAAFPAAVCVVLHIGPNASVLPELLQHRSVLRATHARQGLALEPGRVYVARPDHHLLVTEDTMQLSRGPKENHTRPAIDPLFRSAALHWRERVIGVILSGQLDDGVAGLRAIADCGGITMVQDPGTAAQPEMPLNALKAVNVDHVLPVDGLRATLQRLVAQARPVAAGAPPERLVRENATSEGGKNVMESLAAIGKPSTLTCPECGGVLWELQDQRPLRYRCHTGHAFTSATFEQTQMETTQDALWSAMRALQEREMLLRRLAAISESAGDDRQAEAGRGQADRLRDQVERLRLLIETEPVVADGA